MTLLKLEKLLYYAEGCYLATNNGKKLFDEKIIAWEHGPVVVEVYNAYNDPYHLPLSDSDIKEACNIDKKDQGLLEQVFEVFGKYSAWGLRDKTHEEQPWLEATNGGQRLNQEINQKTMQRYFLENYVSDE